MRKAQWLTASVAVLCSVGVLLTWGCLAELRVYERGSIGRAALHPVCCAGLHNVMEKIDKTYRRAHRLPVRQMRDRNFALMEEHAREIAAHASTLAESADLTGASSEGTVLFEQLADRLGTNAKALSAAAAKKDRAEVRDWFAKVTSTCNACHAAFRGPSHAEHDGDS